MRKNVKVLLSLVMAAAMLAGCGGQSSEKPAENGASGQTTQASAGKEDGAGSEGGKVMTYAMQKEPETLDPTIHCSSEPVYRPDADWPGRRPDQWMC